MDDELTRVIADLQKRVNALELKSRPRESGVSDLMRLNTLIELLVAVLSPSTIDEILARSYQETEHYCIYCFRDQGHSAQCPVELFRLAREMEARR